MRYLAGIFFSAILAGCSTTSAVMPASGGMYTISRSGGSAFISLGSLRKDAYEEASRFAVSKGLEAEVVSVNEVPAGFARFPQVDLRFRLVSPSSRQKTQGVSVITTTTQAGHDAMGNRTDSETSVAIRREVDFYAELKKFGELRERGLLTENEFQAEKKRLLDSRTK